MMRRLWQTVTAVVLVWTAGTVTQTGSLRFPELEGVTQSQVSEVVDAIAAANSGQPAQDLEQMAESLLDSAGGDRTQLLQQLLIYRTRNPGNESAMSNALLLSYYKFSLSEMREALVSLLDTDDAAVRSGTIELLTSIDSANGTQPELSHYAEILDRHEQPPLGLIRYLYSLSPIDGVTLTARRYMVHEEADAALQSALALESARVDTDSGEVRVTPVTRDQIRRLSQHAAWWIRLYAAIHLRDQPELGSGDSLTRLRSDSHPLIRETLAEADSGKSPR